MKIKLAGMIIFSCLNYHLSLAQNVGINTTTPQATLDLRGTQRVGGLNNYMRYDSATGRIEWIGAALWAPVSQQIIRHSASSEGLYAGGGKLEYRNSSGVPVFSTNWQDGNSYFSNKVGIAHLTPQFPLSFSGALGDKISLWTDGTPTHYGMGIQPGLLQVYSKTHSDNIAFGFGSSSSFTQRMVIINSGGEGMELNGRMLLRNGTSPLDINYGPGVWLYKADNSGLLGFMGTQNNQNIGFYGGPAGWGLTYDAINSRVGIGNANPGYQLDVANRMRIRSGGNNSSAGLWLNNNANDLAAFIGMEDDTHVGLYGTGTGWKFGMNTQTGALKINGSEGQAGQALASNGSNSAYWRQLPYAYGFEAGWASITDPTTILNVPGLSNAAFEIKSQSTVIFIVSLGLHHSSNSVFITGADVSVHLKIFNSANNLVRAIEGRTRVFGGYSNSVETYHFTNSYPLNMSPGTYRAEVSVERRAGQTVALCSGCSTRGSLIINVFPQ